MSMLSYKYCTAPDTDDDIYYITACGSDDDYLQTFMVPGSELRRTSVRSWKIICVRELLKKVGSRLDKMRSCVYNQSQVKH